MQILRRHHTNFKDFPSIAVSSQKQDGALVVDFDFKLPNANLNPNFNTEGWDNSGLWNYDVAEVFVKKGSAPGPYLELQVSPLGQKFALLIHEPRVKTEEVEYLKTQVEVQYEDQNFQAKFIIADEDIPGEGPGYYGNCFACLGESQTRGYFALNINPEKTPDYHRPDLFLEISNL